MCKKPKGIHNRIDKCIKSFILSLQSAGFKTLGSCCGHGKYPLTVIIETRPKYRKPFNVELISGTPIPRKRNFYKKDDYGYYYIPEISKPRFKTRIIRRRDGGSVIRRQNLNKLKGGKNKL